MTKKSKEELRHLLMYMDLTINAHHQYITADGLGALNVIMRKHPDFADAKKRHQIIIKLMEEIDK